MKIFKVFRRDWALTCVTKGCNLVYTEPNRKKVYLSVFCFEDTSELRKIITELNNKNILL
jgi:hypothetical protein